MKIKKPILTDILYLLIPFLYIESVFHFNAFGFFDIYTIIRIILFNTLVSIIIVFIFSKISFKYRKWIYFSIVLLMAIYEIMYTKTPPIVAINEALNLAKDYSDDKVKNMINACLDKLYHEEVLDAR